MKEYAFVTFIAPSSTVITHYYRFGKITSSSFGNDCVCRPTGLKW